MLQIYTKHKDYYDGILTQTSSLDRFVRYTQHRKKVKNIDLPEGITKLPLDNRLQYLFFCGSLYPFLESKSKEQPKFDYKNKCINDKSSFLWSYEEISEHLKKYDQLSFCFTEVLQKSFNIGETKLLYNIQLASGVCYFIFNPEYWYGHRSKLLGSDVSGHLTMYPCLQDIQAYKILDPFTAAQKIDYWLSNIFISDDCPSTQTNDEKIVSHGHDIKISFRDSSGKGKKKNEKKRS